MIAGLPKEVLSGETRVALVPLDVKTLVRKGLEIVVEKGAGAQAGYPDSEYEAAGASIVASAADVYQKAEVILKVNRPGIDNHPEELGYLNSKHTVISFTQSLFHPKDAEAIAKTGASLMAMELVPRITRAQKMDALSSMQTCSGYKAVLMAADHLPRLLPMLMTAAGTLKPAKFLILGAGVAGLQAIATAKRLGAVVEAFDTRPVVKEQVMSLGGKFVEVPLTDEEKKEAEDSGGYARQLSDDYYRRQREVIHKHAAAADAVITTAAIFGKKAPILITADMVKDMRDGSVVVDLAVETGGNCELTEFDQNVVKEGVTLIGKVNLPAALPFHASQMYSRNIFELFTHLLAEDNSLNIDTEDEITSNVLVARGGQIVHKMTQEKLGGAA